MALLSIGAMPELTVRRCRRRTVARSYKARASTLGDSRRSALPRRMQQNCAVGRHDPPNILKERVLFTPSEFHSGSKHATTSCQGASVAPAAAKFAWRRRRGIAVRGLDAGSNTQGDLVSAPKQILHKLGVVVSVTVIGIACYVLYHMLRRHRHRRGHRGHQGDRAPPIALAALFVAAGYFTLTFYDCSRFARSAAPTFPTASTRSPPSPAIRSGTMSAPASLPAARCAIASIRPGG